MPQRNEHNKLPPKEEIEAMIDGGISVKEIAKKYKCTYSAVYNKVYYYNYRRKIKEKSELTKLIYDKGYTLQSLSLKLGYCGNVISDAIRGRFTVTLLNDMATELNLTDNQIARIVKGDLI